MRAQVELTSECPECHTRGVWLELYDPAVAASALGLPAEARCRLCAAARVGQVTAGSSALRAAPWPAGGCPFCARPLGEGDLAAHGCRACGARAALVSTRAGVGLGDVEALERALRGLMADEGDVDVAGFVRRAFGTGDLAALAARYAEGAAVDTALDGGTGFLTGAVARVASEAKPGRPSGPAAPPDDRRAMLLALVSVLMADGQRDPREMPLVEAFLAAEGLAPLSAEELRVHRPVEIAARVPVGRREGLVSLMAQLAYADGVADPSEVRVLRAFADAWTVPQEDVDRWLETYRAARRSRQQRLLDRLRAFFLSG